jgi:hypothetical protein
MDGAVRAKLEKIFAAHASIVEPARSARRLSLSRS